jgi:hypothetical protein
LGKTIEEIERIANNELPILLDWLYANRLSLNIKKTHIMLFGGKRNSDYDIKILINGEKIFGHSSNSKNWQLELSLIRKKGQALLQFSKHKKC